LKNYFIQGDEEIKSVRLDKEVAENLTKLKSQEEEISKQNEVCAISFRFFFLLATFITVVREKPFELTFVIFTTFSKK